MKDDLSERVNNVVKKILDETGFHNIKIHLTDSPKVLCQFYQRSMIIKLNKSFVSVMTDDQIRVIIGHELGHTGIGGGKYQTAISNAKNTLVAASVASIGSAVLMLAASSAKMDSLERFFGNFSLQMSVMSLSGLVSQRLNNKKGEYECDLVSAALTSPEDVHSLLQLIDEIFVTPEERWYSLHPSIENRIQEMKRIYNTEAGQAELATLRQHLGIDR